MKKRIIDHVPKLHDTQKENRNQEEELVVATIENNKAASIQVEASAKVMDDNIVHEIITDLKNIGVVDKTP